MSTLFTLNQSWHNATWVFEQLAFASRGDGILLLEDAVLGLASSITLASFLAKCESQDIRVYALADDCRVRGIDCQLAGVKLVDYSGFVALTVEHDKQVVWR